MIMLIKIQKVVIINLNYKVPIVIMIGTQSDMQNTTKSGQS